jgi:hypothetical protein
MRAYSVIKSNGGSVLLYLALLLTVSSLSKGQVVQVRARACVQARLL